MKIRWTVRILFLVAFAALAVFVDQPVVLHGILPACSPFAALVALAAGGASLILLPAALVLLITFIKPRFFCRWVCPAGTCFEAAGARFPKYRWIGRFPRLGTWLLFIGLGAALIGYPLFLALDPLAIFSSAFTWIRPDLSVWEIIGACILPLMILLAAALPWLWCGRICPLGALQDVTAMPANLRERRKHAGVATDASRAMQRHEIMDTGRRLFMGLGIGAAYRLLLNPTKLSAATNVIRPPVSGSEARFTRLCARCGACARACPDQIIKQSAENGFAGLLAPELDFSRGACPPECTRCGVVCPTGAIPCFSEEDKYEHPLGLAVLKSDLCVLSHDRECGVCMNACVHQAISIVWDPVEMVSTLKIDPERCTGCGICEYVCPERPVAVVVESKEHRVSAAAPRAMADK